MKMFENAQAGDRVYSRLHGEGEINIIHTNLDYSIYNCRQAIEDFRAAHNIQSPIHTVDWTGVYWRKEIK